MRSLNGNDNGMSTPNKQDKPYVKATVTNIYSQPPLRHVTMEKEQLFETFLLFQSFVNQQQQQQQLQQHQQMNTGTSINMNTNSNTHSNNYYTETTNINVNKSSRYNEPQLSTLKDDVTVFTDNTNTHNVHNNNITDNNKHNDESSSSPDNDKDLIKPISNSIEPKKNSYDDIPIKPSNSNFMELLEKNLATDTTVPLDQSQPKKKVIKTQHVKKVVNVSKPSKNEKKYTYYTDFLDENGKLNQAKIASRHRTRDSSPPKKTRTYHCNLNKEETPLITESKDEEQQQQQPQMSLLDVKIKELNDEMKRYKDDKMRTQKLKNDYDELCKELQSNIELLKKEQNEFEEYVVNENEKLQNEKKVNANEVKMINTLKSNNQLLMQKEKKNKEIIDELKSQISKLQVDIKKKDKSDKTQIDKQKVLIDKLKQIEAQQQQHNDKSLEAATTAVVVASSTRGKSVNTNNAVSGINTGVNVVNSVNTNTNNTNTASNSNNKFPKSKTEHTFQDKKNINDPPSSSSKKQPSPQQQQQPHSHQQHPSKKPKTTKPKQQQPSSSLTSHKPTPPQSTPSPSHYINQNFPPFDPQETYDFILSPKYADNTQYTLIKTASTTDGKTINLYTNNKREVIFQSGVRKEIFNDNHQIVYFTNGDLKQIFPNGTSVYYFNDAKTVQTSYPDGIQVFKFNGGQIEKHYPNGTKQIVFPDGSLRYILSNGYEETHYKNKTVQIIDLNNIITIEHVNGMKEIKYPDGREEVVYPEGFDKEQMINNNK